MQKKLLKSLILFSLIILISTFILTITNYFNLLPTNIISILKLIIPLSAITISSYKLGKQSEKKGYIEGIKLGTIIIGIFIILVVILDKFKLSSLLYYLILFLTSILSSMIGINRKKPEQKTK